MTVEEQFTAIRDPAFFTGLKAQVKKVLAALQANGVGVEGTLHMAINGVEISCVTEEDSQDVMIDVGDDGNENSLYKWKYPMNWMTA